MDIKKVHLKNFSSLAVGGFGEMAVATSVQDLIELCMNVRNQGKKLVPIGGGTNIFFGETCESSVFVKMFLRGVSYTEEGDTGFITAYAGEIWDDVVSFTVSKGLWGIENLSSIPGSVGAAPIQNIGAYGAELADVLDCVNAIDTTTLNSVVISNEACQFGYRDSLFKKEQNRYIITSVTLKLSKKRKPILTYKPLDLLSSDASQEEIRKEVIRVRAEKLPDYATYPNAGSFFKNPVVEESFANELKNKYPLMPQIKQGAIVKIPAAWLIEHIAEAKGVRHGDVGTWPNQPLVLVNYGVATSEEILNFSKNIIDNIFEKTGIKLEREVNFVS